MQIELELLAPAGNLDIGIAAINCGADAVYIAGPSYGAREAASNSIEDIEKLCNYAHKFSAKVYLALNTILYDSEIEEAVSIACKSAEAGIDALIIQDLGLLKCNLPQIPIFASTQTNVRNLEQAQFLESLGIKRLILARELSLKQIKEISTNCNAELESFVHGALCVSYSGQCYLSQKMSKRSANRGSCMQACRLKWDLVDENNIEIVKNRPLLSLKDLNLAESIPALAEAGITSFKIEGRLKNSSYIKNIVRYYRQQIDNLIESDKRYSRSSEGDLFGGFTPNPDYTFNRGYTQLNINDKREEWTSGFSAKGRGEQIGVVKSVKKDNFSNAVIDILTDKKLNNGDGFYFISPAGEEFGARAATVLGSTIVTNESINVPVGSITYRNLNKQFEKELENNMPQRLINLELRVKVSEEKMVLEVIKKGDLLFEKEYITSYTIAENREIVRRNIEVQLSKQYDVFRFSVYLEELKNPQFYPLSFLNSTRRAISDEILSILSIKKPKVSIERPKNNVKYTGFTDYRANSSNRFSKQLYYDSGIKSIDSAYEIEPKLNLELMRTKFCIKFELGMCPKYGGVRNDSKLYIKNGNEKFALDFDCKRCEMVVKG